MEREEKLLKQFRILIILLNCLGWVGVLARWMRNPDLRVQVTAAKALANMDSDDQYLNEYQTKVYPLYPLRRVRRKQQLDIIFIHGLLGE